MGEDLDSTQQQTEWIALSIASEYPQGKIFTTCLITPFIITYLSHLIAGDLVGKLLAYASMSPYVLICSFITLILFRRDLHTVYINFLLLFCCKKERSHL